MIFKSVSKSLKEHQCYIHFQYVFTEIKTQTSSLIIFLELARKKKFLKDNKHASYEDFLFITVEKERDKFFIFYRRQQNEKS